MTTRREVPFSPDALGWVHAELADIKSRLVLLQQAAEHSRGLAIDASDKSHAVEAKIDPFLGNATAIGHLQDDLHAARDLLARAQDDIHSLRQSREEIERRVLADAERGRQDRNEISRRFAEVERQVEGWQERFVGVEEHSRRNLEAAAQLLQRMEAIEAVVADVETLQSRTLTTVSRIDNEIVRLSGALVAFEREDAVQRERVDTALEVLRRFESEVEAIKAQTSRLSRMDDRLELVQAERTRHNERLNEITAELAQIDKHLNDHGERTTLVEARMTSYQESLRSLHERLQQDRERLAAYIRGVADLEAEFRKRQGAALEKESRDLKSRALGFAEE